jgi:hypothetical protein
MIRDTSLSYMFEKVDFIRRLFGFKRETGLGVKKKHQILNEISSLCAFRKCRTSLTSDLLIFLAN